MDRDYKRCKPRFQTIWFARTVVASLALATVLLSGGACEKDVVSSDDGKPVATKEGPDADAQRKATEEYWTEERMREAKPLPMGRVYDPGAPADAGKPDSKPEGSSAGEPGSVSGKPPRATP